MTAPPLLTVEDLRVAFEGDRGTVTEAVAETGVVCAVSAVTVLSIDPSPPPRVSMSFCVTV